MSHPLELPDAVYSALKAAAEASGTTPLGWIVARLPENGSAGATAQQKTLADLFAGRTGRIRSAGAEALSEACGEKFAHDLERKRSEGHL